MKGKKGPQFQFLILGALDCIRMTQPMWGSRAGWIVNSCRQNTVCKHNKNNKGRIQLYKIQLNPLTPKVALIQYHHMRKFKQNFELFIKEFDLP